MKKHVLATSVSLLSAALICNATPAEAAKQNGAVKSEAPPVVAAASPAPYPSPPEIVAAAPAGDWVAIAPSDLLVMDLAADAKGKPRRVVIQLMPAPFSQGWVGNIRKLAAAKFWDGLAIVRVQDNYVTQWGDPDGEDLAKAKKLPDGLAVVPESEYKRDYEGVTFESIWNFGPTNLKTGVTKYHFRLPDPYAQAYVFSGAFPLGLVKDIGSNSLAPVHCYGMVGVGRNLSPDTGTGAELYTVIGHAPRHLDRNIALVGRIIEGMEHMSSLPRGTGALGFYEKPEERTAILSVRLRSEMETDKPLPTYEYLNTESASFAKYADARANRRDPFFIKPAGGADICNIPVPVRRKG
jgi:peptidylprolyl isomerase